MSSRYNKADLTSDSLPPCRNNEIARQRSRPDSNIRELKEQIARPSSRTEPNTKRLVADLLAPSDTVVLVVPIDSAAPKGRLILPQQQTIRDILEAGAISLVTRETELTAHAGMPCVSRRSWLSRTRQAFGIVDKLVPENMSS